MHVVKVERAGRPEQEVASAAELDAVLAEATADAASAGRAYDVQITHDSGGTLGVVVGDRRSVLNHVPRSLDPPYRVSVGDEVSDQAFVFYVAGDHYTEAAWRNTIPTEDALEAARHFASTGALTPAVLWEDV